MYFDSGMRIGFGKTDRGKCGKGLREGGLSNYIGQLFSQISRNPPPMSHPASKKYLLSTFYM
jgi:hypothetical protein